MINTAYIKEYAPHDQFMYESHFIVLDVEDAEKALIALETNLEEKKFFGESTDEFLIYMEAEKKNIFTSIGEGIINMFKSIIDFLKNSAKSLKDCITGTRKKLNDEKALEAMRQNPELAKDFLQSVLNGDIKARDIKDLNKMIEEATEITKKLTKGTYDKPTFSDKMQKLGDNIEKATKPVMVILGLIAAGTGAIVGINNLRDRKMDNVRNEINMRKSTLGQGESLNRDTRNRLNDKVDKLFTNKSFKNKLFKSSGEDIYEGDYLVESASPIDAVKKVLDFLSERATFCETAMKKLEGLKAILQDKLKTAKTSEDASTIKTAMSGLQPIMGIITKEMNTTTNIANKAYKKAGGDK